MIITPEMFKISCEIDRLRARLAKDPGDHMVEYEFDSLVARYDNLAKFEKLGLKVVLGGLHSSNRSTLNSDQLENKAVDEA